MAHHNETQTIECEFGTERFRISVAFFRNGHLGEIAVQGYTHSASREAVYDDACALINALLQRFVSIEKISEMMARKENGYPASLIGSIVFKLAQTS